MKNLLRRVAARIAENEFWLVWVYGAPLVFASNLPPLVFYLALCVIPFFWLARRMARGTWTVATPLDVPLALLLGLGVIGVVVSNELPTSALLYAQWLGGTALYFGIVNGMTPARFPYGLWILLVLASGMGLVGLLGLNFTDKFLPVVFYDYLPRADFSFLNPRGFTPNIVAGAIAPVIPVALVWAARQRGARRILALGLALMLLGVVVLTQSRGALLGLVAVSALLIGWRFPRSRWVAPLAAVLVVGALLYIGPVTLAEAVLVSDSTGSAGGRLELWDRALHMWRDFPFTGIGIGTFERTALSLYPLMQSSPGVPQPHAHNLYLQMGVDFGIGGFIAFLGLVLITLVTGIQNVRRAPSTVFSALAFGLLAGYLVYLLHGMLDAVAVSTKVSIVVWLILALIMAQAREITPEP